MKTLRPDQNIVIQKLRDELKRTKRVVMQGPTGSGKTIIMSDITSMARDRGKKVLITVPALSLVDQTVAALGTQGVDGIGVIQAQHQMTDWSQPVQVCSVQTLANRWRDGQMPEADLVLVDEVHRMFEMFSTWLPDPRWAQIPFIGFSATPWSKGLGSPGLYQKLVTGSTIPQLIDKKVLVPFRTFAPDTPDLTGVRTVAGEFVASDLEEVMRPKRLVANIVSTWKDLAHGRPTVAFCCSRAHAKQLANEFNEAGIGADSMDCETPLPEREEVRRRMLDGDISVVCNVDVIGLGVDWPEVSCIIYARPTMSDMRFVQNIGRGLRSSPGKDDLLILDHSTTTQRLGFVDEIYNYHGELDDGRTKAKEEKAVLLPKECPACHLMKPPRVATCPHCGFKAEHHAEPVPVERGTLREVMSPDYLMAALRKKLPDKPNCYGQLWWWASQKGYKPGWSAVKVKEIFGAFPKGREPDPETIGPPVPELLEYIYVSTEKWKKAQYNAKRAQQRRAYREDDGVLGERGQALVERASEELQ